MATTQIHLSKPKLELSGLTIDDTGEVLRFVFRGEAIGEVLKDYDLETLLGLMNPWKVTPKDSAEVWTVYAGPHIEKSEILEILPECEIERIG